MTPPLDHVATAERPADVAAPALDYEKFFRGQLDALRREGRYRIFADLERRCGAFPAADHHRAEGRAPVTVWCSNDYLGMDQHPDVLDAMHETIASSGAGTGGTRNISGTVREHVALEQELAGLHGKEAALIFTSGWISNLAALGTLGRLLPNARSSPTP